METTILLLKLKHIILMLKSPSPTQSSLCNSRDIQCPMYKVSRKIKKRRQALRGELCPCQPDVAPGVTLSSTYHLQPSRIRTTHLVSGDRDLHTGSLLCKSGAWSGGALRNTWKGMNEGNRIGQRERLRWDVVVVTEIKGDPAERSRRGAALRSCPD